MAKGAKGFGGVEVASYAAKAGLGIAAGTVGILDSLGRAKQKRQIWQQKQNYFFNIEQPLEQRKNIMTHDSMIKDMMEGGDIQNQYSIGTLSQEGAMLRTAITSQDIAKRIEFEAERQMINQEERAGVTQGIFGALGSLTG